MPILKCFFLSRDKLLLTRAFCTLVRPLLELSSVTWSPYYFKNEINKIESVHKSFKNSIANLRSSTYKDRHVNSERVLIGTIIS